MTFRHVAVGAVIGAIALTAVGMYRRAWYERYKRTSSAARVATGVIEYVRLTGTSPPSWDALFAAGILTRTSDDKIVVAKNGTIPSADFRMMSLAMPPDARDYEEKGGRIVSIRTGKEPLFIQCDGTLAASLQMINQELAAEWYQLMSPASSRPGPQD
jgi:hypothetical protein